MFKKSISNGRVYVGVSCTGHDNAIALVSVKGEVLYAQAAERLYQVKQATNMAADESKKMKALIEKYCPNADELVICKSWSENTAHRMNEEIARIKYDAKDGSIDAFFAKQSQLKLTDNLNTWIMPNVSMAGYGTKAAAAELGIKVIDTVLFDHHLTHAAYACYTSGFKSAACVVVDGYGEDTSHSLFHYSNNALTPLQMSPYKGNQSRLSASLGVFFGVTVCALCGFAPNSGEEWKVMGLAPYGKLDSKVYEVLKRHIQVEDGKVVLPVTTNDASIELTDYRCSYQENPSRCADLAHTAQYFFSELMVSLLEYAQSKTGEENLVLCGGCALNSSFNGTVLAKTKFVDMFVPSAPGDDGNAIGAGFLGLKKDSYKTEIYSSDFSPYLGDEISEKDTKHFIEKSLYPHVEKFIDSELYHEVASLLANGKVVAWVQGRAEFGPRALGNRSILADPRSSDMKEKINRAVKFREPFRPFAPAILAEYGEDYFENYNDSPYMERTQVFREGVREEVQAVCHADYTGRAQSVTIERNAPLYYLIDAFYKITGTPVLLNTSLNVMGKPIVSSINDVISTFQNADIDILVIGSYVFKKG